ncbi:MAG: PepSY domain-containing protein [Isosphaeraceae bacterium]
MRFNKFGCVAAWGMIGLLAVPALGDDDLIDLAQVPAVVTQAAAKAVPGARWTSAEKDDEDGKVVYELSGANAKGQVVDVSVTAEGTVLEVETEIALADVPAVVTAALKAKHPKFKPESVESVAKNGKVVAYEFDGDGPNGEDVEISVSADGKTVNIVND